MDAVVLGNVTLDILCYPVDDVPRHDSIRFERAQIGPGGCGSNVAIGLCALGIRTALVAWIGGDDAYALVERYWERVSLDRRFIQNDAQSSTAVSVGLVDSDLQPRFIHTSGANHRLTVDDLDLPAVKAEGARALIVAGFFVMPGLLDGRLPESLAQAQALGMLTLLDVVNSPRMDHPEPLWPCLPYLNVFLCNTQEGARLSGAGEPVTIARYFRSLGAKAVVVKLGADGCWLDCETFAGRIPAQDVAVVDTTGAGDAFAAGLLAALLRGADLRTACEAGNAAGGRIVGAFGTVAGWL